MPTFRRSDPWLDDGAGAKVRPIVFMCTGQSVGFVVVRGRVHKGNQSFGPKANPKSKQEAQRSNRDVQIKNAKSKRADQRPSPKSKRKVQTISPKSKGGSQTTNGRSKRVVQKAKGMSKRFIQKAKGTFKRAVQKANAMCKTDTLHPNRQRVVRNAKGRSNQCGMIS